MARARPFFQQLLIRGGLIALVLAPLIEGWHLRQQERAYGRRGVQVEVLPVNGFEVTSQVAKNGSQHVVSRTLDLRFETPDGQVHAVRRSLNDEDVSRLVAGRGRGLQAEYLPEDPDETVRLVGHHLNPGAGWTLAGGAVILLGVFW